MQNLIDYSLQKYGTIAALFVLMEDNPQLFSSGREIEITSSLDTEKIVTRSENDLMDKKTLKELNGKIIVSE